MRRRACFILIGFILALNACSAAEFSGRVVAVTDGDTIGVLVANEEYKIRLHGIDTPERKQDFGTRAKQFTSDLVFGKEVRVEVKYRDRYGREVGVVYLVDGRNLNHELVKAGMAWWYEEYAPNDETLEQLQTEARKNRRGLWRDPHPQSPWDFRKQQAAKRAAANSTGKRPSTDRPAPSRPDAIEPTEQYRHPPAATEGNLVVIAPTGEKYHTLTCRHGRNGKQVTLESAQSGGYTPCNVCRSSSTPAIP